MYGASDLAVEHAARERERHELYGGVHGVCAGCTMCWVICIMKIAEQCASCQSAEHAGYLVSGQFNLL